MKTAKDVMETCNQQLLEMVKKEMDDELNKARLVVVAAQILTRGSTRLDLVVRRVPWSVDDEYEELESQDKEEDWPHYRMEISEHFVRMQESRTSNYLYVQSSLSFEDFNDLFNRWVVDCATIS